MIKVSPDTPKIIALEGMVDELTTALAAKTEDFGRLCKYFDAHNAELKRIIAWLRAELALAAAAERERCAKVCEDRGNRNRIAANLPNADRDEFYCADDIRALGGE